MGTDTVQFMVMTETDTSLKELQTMIRKFCDDRDWDQFHNLKDLTISLSLEAAELLEHTQWKSNQQMIDHLNNHREEVSDELADVFYWVLLIANKTNIDLTEAFKKKMLINESKYPVDASRGSSKKYTELQG